jgi:hypothetical protein
LIVFHFNISRWANRKKLSALLTWICLELCHERFLKEQALSLYAYKKFQLSPKYFQTRNRKHLFLDSCFCAGGHLVHLNFQSEKKKGGEPTIEYSHHV